MDSKYPWVKYLVLILISVAIGWLMHRPAPLPMVEIPDVSTNSVQQGMKDAGLPVSKPEAKEIAEEIKHRVKDTKPDYEGTFKNIKDADKKMDEVAKADGADAVLKEVEQPKDYGVGKGIGDKLQTAPVQAKYYGIHYEPKNAIGVYADIDKDGSYGIHVRKDRVALDVGKKYKDGSITGRVIWEAIKIK